MTKKILLASATAIVAGFLSFAPASAQSDVSQGNVTAAEFFEELTRNGN